MITLVPRDSIIGLLVAPTIWMGAFVLIYGVVGTACALGIGMDSINGINTVRLIALLIAALSGLVIALAGVQAFRLWQDARHTMVDADELTIRKRHEFLYMTTLWLCVLSLVGTAWMAMAILMNPICEG